MSARSGREMPIVMNQGVQTGVAEWEEPRHSGRLVMPTVPHYLPLRNTIPHLSVRRSLKVRPGYAAFGSRERDSAGGRKWVDSRLKTPFHPHGCDLGAILRANRRLGGLLAGTGAVPLRLKATPRRRGRRAAPPPAPRPPAI